MASPALRLTWFDRLLGGIAPRWAARRVRAKASFALLGRYYEAAGGGHRTAGWHRGGGDANAPAVAALPRLRELSRDLRRNNGWARRGIGVIASNTVGWGIIAKPTGPNAARMAELWKAWADSPRCDFDGRLSFYGLQRLVMETVVESGEALVVRQPAGERDGLQVPLRLQVLEPDYLDLGRSSFPDLVSADPGNRIVQGIEYDAGGRRVAYWLYRTHPQGGMGGESRRVAAENVLHVCRVERPGQVHGVPWLAAAIARLNDLDEYEDARLMQQKIAACLSVIVQDVDGTAGPVSPDAKSPEDLESLEPGQFHYLPPGKTVQFSTPPSTSDHGSFTSSHLRRVAATLGVTFEDLTSDYSNVNFSSARMARLAHWRNVEDWQWNMLIPQFCDGAFRWFAEVAGALEDWRGGEPTAEWSPQPMPMLDPQKEAAAYQQLVRIGALTWPQMVRERGEDPEKQFAELERWNGRFDGAGIVLDCDPRRTSTAGLLQGGGAAKGAAPATADDDSVALDVDVEGDDQDDDQDDADDEDAGNDPLRA